MFVTFDSTNVYVSGVCVVSAYSYVQLGVFHKRGIHKIIFSL